MPLLQCIDACRLFTRQLGRALAGENKQQILFADADLFLGAPKIVEIAQGRYRNKDDKLIRGTGYVVDCLEAALWCFWSTGTFSEAILKAANLGDDADTTAAVCGQIAGAYYGMSAIPAAWKEKLAMFDIIQYLARQLFQFNVEIA